MISALRPLTRIGHWLATPLVPEAYLELIDPLLGAGLRGRVERVVQESPGAVSLQIRPNGKWQGAIAGQYVRLGVDIDGVRHWRCYSVSSGDAGRDAGRGRVTMELRVKDIVTYDLNKT